jgi:foldase protein PrsA
VADVRRWTAIARKSSGEGPARVRQLHEQVIQLLTGFAWIDGEAREQGIAVSDDEVQTRYQEEKRQSFPKDEDFQTFLKVSGQRVDDILQRVRLDMLSEKIRDRVIATAAATVTDAAVDEFVATHPQRVPERRDFRMIFARTRATAQAARVALERGLSWTATAKRYSADHRTNQRGGLLKWVPEGSIEHPLERAVFRARRNRLTGPVHTASGYYVFTVVAVHPGRAESLAKQREAAREILVEDAQQQALGTFVKAYTAKWTARTTCAPAYAFAKECANRK